MKKRFLNLFLVMVMLLCVLPFTASAECAHDYDITVTKEATCKEEGEKKFDCKNCDAWFTWTVSKTTTHTPKVNPGVKATCTEKGYTDGSVCAVCDAILTYRQEIDALTHNWVNGICDREGCGAVCDHADKTWINKIPATCEATGLTGGFDCNICKKQVDGRETIAALNHRYNDGTVTKKATCTEAGVKTFVCLNDGCEHKKTEPIAATGHTYSTASAELSNTCIYCLNKCNHEGTLVETTPAKEATCDDAPFIAGEKCTVCNYEKAGQYYGAGLGHNWVNGVCDREGCGKACEHKDKTWIVSVAATCETPGMTGGYECNDCKEIVSGHEVVPATGHTYSTVDNLTDTCIYCMHKCDHAGKIEITEPAKEATCDDAPFIAGEKCTECNYKKAGQYYGVGLGHNWVNGICDREGCGKACEHKDKTWVISVAATCETPGMTGGYECNDCKEIVSGHEVVPATGHTYSTVDNLTDTCIYCMHKCDHAGKIEITEPAREATCYNAPFLAGEKCTECNYKKAGQYYGVGLGHSLKLDFASTEPTCTEKGWGKYVCERDNCTYSETGWVDALGHDYEVVVQADATCTQIGREGKECKLCKHQVITSTEPTGHTEEIMPAVEATCTATGLTEGKKCATCGFIIDAQEEVAMIDHSWTDRQGESATCTVDGYTAYKECTACGLTEGKEIIKAAHTFKEGEFKCAVCEASNPDCKHPQSQVTFVHKDSTCTEHGIDGWTCNTCGEKSEKELPLAAHKTGVKTTAATCTANGETVESCTVCKKEIKRIEIPMVAHNYVNGACSVCGAIDSGYTAGTPGTPTTPAAPTTPGTSECQHEKSTVINPATCTNSGYKIVTCPTCNKVITKELLPALGHKYETELVSATCVKSGSKIEKCTVCGDFNYEVLPATGNHQYNSKTNICSICNGANPAKSTSDYQDVFLTEADKAYG